jgi:hypothetical protein
MLNVELHLTNIAINIHITSICTQKILMLEILQLHEQGLGCSPIRVQIKYPFPQNVYMLKATYTILKHIRRLHKLSE